MLLRVFIDDSSDQFQQSVMLAGAFLGWYHQWNQLQKEWKKRLKQDRLKYFRSTECRSLQGEFLKFRDEVKYPKPQGREAADKIRDDLEGIIHKSGVMGVAACVPMRAYKAIRATEPDAAEIFPEDAFEVALQALFQLCYETVQNEMRKDIGVQRVALICDDSTSAPRISRMFDEFLAKNPSYRDVLESLVHRDDKKLPQLQAADLMAHLAKDRFTEWLTDPAIFTNQPELKKRLKRLSVYSIGVCHQGWLMDVLRRERESRGL